MAKRSPRRQRKSLGLFRTILLIAFLGVFAYSAYRIGSILMEDKKAEKIYSDLRMEAREKTAAETTPLISEDETLGDTQAPPKRANSVSIPVLQESYPEIAAWIFAEGTGIDHPVMKTADNDYYLTHLYDGTSNASGALFVDYRNSGVFTDDNTVIYGHNMADGGMFNAIMEYKSQEFYETHPTMVITAPDGDYLVELICGSIEDGNYEFVRFSFTDFDAMESYVTKVKSRSTFHSDVQLQPGDKLVSLCTCTYEDINARYMLIGRVSELYR